MKIIIDKDVEIHSYEFGYKLLYSGHKYYYSTLSEVAGALLDKKMRVETVRDIIDARNASQSLIARSKLVKKIDKWGEEIFKALDGKNA